MALAVQLKKTLSVFRVFFPSWRFFDEVGVAPRLSVRWGVNETALGDWKYPTEPEDRNWSFLFYNPRVNLYLACQTLVERLTHDLEEVDEVGLAHLGESVSYQLVDRWARWQLRHEATARFYQFRIDGRLESPVGHLK